MISGSKLCAALLVAGLGAAPAAAATVGASGSASVGFSAGSAYDILGNPYIPEDWLAFMGENEISTASGVSLPNTTASTPTFTRTYTVTNTSVDIFIDWIADIMINTFANGFIQPEAAGDFYFDSNTFLTAGSISSFSSVNATYACAEPDPLDPGFDCFGVSAFNADSQFASESGTLNPGESVTFTLTAQSFATQRYTAPAAVPLPASGVLLGLGLLAFLATQTLRGIRSARPRYA
jgi:hypothetical protein